MVWGGKFTSLKRYWNFHFSFSKTSLVYLNIIFVIKLCFFVLHCIRIKQISMAAYLLVMGPMPGSYQTETCFISLMHSCHLENEIGRYFSYNNQGKKFLSKKSKFFLVSRANLLFGQDPFKKNKVFLLQQK